MALAFFLSACSSVMHSGVEPEPGGLAPLAPRHSIIFVVHGDGDYLFHDTDGRAFQADEEEVAAAKRVANRNPEAEVFIFHQQSRRRVLFLFPRPSGKFYLYRGGELVAEQKYRRSREGSRLQSEQEIYARFRSERRGQGASLFLYSGHEVPESDGRGYDLSMSHQAFAVDDLAQALAVFTEETGILDLMVLSTCFGGTPYTVGKLAPFARTIVASPDNLHLSYFDLQPLEHLTSPANGPAMASLSVDFARNAFDLLSEEVQTAVTVAVYDTDLVQDYLVEALRSYRRIAGSPERASRDARRRVDCAAESHHGARESKGVQIFYRPPRFGRGKGTLNHSGWECWAVPTLSP